MLTLLYLNVGDFNETSGMKPVECPGYFLLKIWNFTISHLLL